MTTKKGVMDIFMHNKIIPDVITKASPDLNILQVAFGNEQISAGQELSPSLARTAPNVNWSADNNQLYTLIMVDPDAPNREEHTFRNWLHWLITNIPGNNLHQGDQLCDYMGPSPPARSGLHRYVFLAYQQPSKIDVSREKKGFSGRERASWRVSDFLSRHSMSDDQLIAANMFQAKNE